MIRLSRYSEPFAASGGMGARTTRRALGARTLSFWELFLRGDAAKQLGRPPVSSRCDFVLCRRMDRHDGATYLPLRLRL